MTTMTRDQARRDSLAALHAAIAGGSLRPEDRRRLVRRIDRAQVAERITALEARALREAVATNTL
jgi:hypothetical protein